ncbi:MULTISPECIES: polyprenyl synthetase family protein [unclassified Luteococcus]|uniref:polyprenyl synthetase family protein n=1 Tax=unclassified Luteococcus TaxID=2639923 RepID=UPI00313CEEFC
MATAEHPFSPADPAGADFRTAVGTAITTFLDQRRTEVSGIGAELDLPLELAKVFTGGGKRVRPAFCYWGRVAAGGTPDDPDALVRAAASLDLLHVSALMHDDVMDASDVRRGVPAAHRQFEQLHRQRGGRGSAEAFGRAGAILLGDLLLVWSEELLANSGLDAGRLAASRPLIEAMRTEVTCGQFLDVIAQSAPATADLEQALATANRVVEYKTNRYTVQRPLQFGAALGGADATLLEQLVRFASPIGRAFQFRDDLLGIFGDEQLTGKPAGDDLREGKRTVLVAHALAKAPADQAAELDAMLGDADLTRDQVERGRQIITASGAKEAVESTIDAAFEQAMAALEQASVTDEGRVALAALAEACVRRDH